MLNVSIVGCGFCNGQPLWDTKLTWYNDYPAFTFCFINTIVILVPCAWLWFFGLIYLISIIKMPHTMPLKIDCLQLSKIVLASFLAACILTATVKASLHYSHISETSLKADVICPTIRIATIIFFIVLTHIQHRRRVATSALLFFFWLFELIFGVVPFYSSFVIKMYNTDPFSFSITTIDYLLVIALFILACFAARLPPDPHTHKERFPMTEASLLSLFSFFWLTPLVIGGYRKELDENDFWDLPQEAKSETVGLKTQKAWQKELCRSGLVRSTKLDAGRDSLIMDRPLLPGREMTLEVNVANVREDDDVLILSKSKRSTSMSEYEDVNEDPPRVTASILRCLIQVFAWDICKTHALAAVQLVIAFVFPLLLQLLIEFVDTPMTDTRDTWKGYFYGVLYFGAAVIQSVVVQQVWYRGYTIGLGINTGLCSLIYRKVLTIGTKGMRASSSGTVVNLMSVDAERFADFMKLLWCLWLGPVQFALAMAFLYYILGPSVFAGLVVIVVAMPANVLIMGMFNTYEERLMRLKDRRIKLTNEMFMGMKVLKLYAWETSFQEKVMAIREVEMRNIRKVYILLAFAIFLWILIPFLVSLATFATYVNVDPSHYLSPSVAFTANILFGIIQFTMNMFPALLGDLARVRVAIRRISNFLCEEDIDPDNIHRNAPQEAAITIENGTFEWRSEIGPTLKDLQSTKLTSPLKLTSVNHHLEIKELGVLQSNGKGRKRRSGVLSDNDDEIPEQLSNLFVSCINIHVPCGSLVMIVGSVGSGKSSMLSAILGEMEKISGIVNQKGSVAYVPQEAWIQNATLRDNILFFLDYDQSKYEKVLDVCALRQDLSVLSAGDLTEIGEKGINLSGGQRQRVSVARAVYRESDIYLLDDPLSAVDAHVGRQIFEQVISDNGVLKKKTRVMVTNGVHWLPHADTIVVVSGGRVSETGSYDQLLQHDGDFAKFLRTYLQENMEHSDSEDGSVAEREKLLERLTSIQLTDSGGNISDAEGSDHTAIKIVQKQMDDDSSIVSSLGDRMLSGTSLSRSNEGLLSRTNSRISRNSTSLGQSKDDQGAEKAGVDRYDAKAGLLVEEEEAGSGKVKWSVYMAYAQAAGLTLCLMVIVFNVLYQGCQMFSSIWLQMWTDDRDLANATIAANSSLRRRTNDLYLGIYGMLGITQVVFIMAYGFVMAFAAVRASSTLHKDMLASILHAPMAFFDTTPTGRIINRFTKDMDSVDEVLPEQFLSWIMAVFLVIVNVAVISYSLPIFLSIFAPAFVIFYLIQRVYVTSARQVRRLQSKSESPVYTHLSESLSGATVIRAYREQGRFIRECEARVDATRTYEYAYEGISRWLGFLLSALGNIGVLAAVMFAVSERGHITGGIVGLAIQYALQITESLSWFVETHSQVEGDIVAVERIKNYTDINHEADWVKLNHRPHQSWPQEGHIEFKNYMTRYRADLDLVLRGINVDIEPGKKVGIVGRTGAGKSSLTLALFRVIESAAGSICIDGVDIATIGLHDLRSRLTILPQEPVIFSGSLRMNLDPFNQYTDHDLWVSLQHAHLGVFVESLPEGLSHDCGEGGQNLSMGQRQLLCLARALLKKTTILILDEATAAVDMETDQLIQATIREEFRGCTILTIAHRLNTIMDYDKILVLSDGLVAQYDTPDNLLACKHGIFYDLASNADLV